MNDSQLPDLVPQTDVAPVSSVCTVFSSSCISTDGSQLLGSSYAAPQTRNMPLAWPELDALVCVSDELACGALYECQRRRIKVPDDLAVVGFGDSDVSRVCQPPLTTMAVPHRKIGIEAGKALLERLNDGDWRDHKPIASSLCLRESC